ncbi:two-component system osmolarity sensor histidine kinase EnvZ [Defluviimonas denitrificans]|jgi:two-component system osmolarity sensor histidine kinase EnvZ|uniref:histidine kinase n=1 Tax=Albidovulum denitrificans TaxID=404881 RepID=A0A2S8SBR4_9RHOB|nr:two-component system osmolarity sensor histidine kinase EnvZ [Defluviimonas denitrificans]
MLSRWIKNVMPRGLYGRAALILILPIVTIQLVVSIAFIQRHFEDVTRQMTENVVQDVALILDRVNRAPDLAAAEAQAAEFAGPLSLAVTLPAPVAEGDSRVFYDLSGRVVIATLRGTFPTIGAIDLYDLKTVRITLGTEYGPMQVELPRRRVSASNPHQLLVLMLVTGLLMTTIAFIFLRNQIRPIRRLAVAAEAFGKGRVVAYRPTGATEVRAAGNAFLDMRARIERQIEQRTLLLSGVSHDLRTPLTRLKLGLSMLDPDEEVEALRRDTAEMEGLLDSFLSFVRDEAQDEAPVTTDPVALLRTVVEDARRGGQNVSLHAVEGAGTAPLREIAVRRALANLIGNAVRYGTRAEVSVAISDRALRFSVEDDGPGIPKERREEAMRPFTRLDRARNQNLGTGVGLGLAITADIARGHGGTLRLTESERLGGLRADLVLAR